MQLTPTRSHHCARMRERPAAAINANFDFLPGSSKLLSLDVFHNITIQYVQGISRHGYSFH